MKKFECFKVYNDCDKYAFIEISSDVVKKVDAIFEWAFTDEKRLRYADLPDYDASLTLNIEQRKAIMLSLKKFIDEKNIGVIPFDKKYKDILNTLIDEDLVFDDGTKLNIRKDKIGKLGEFIFYNVLSDYFTYNCILNKANLITSYNMSVYGMDELFYCEKDNMLLFGESKFCKSLDNGIKLINKSLDEYEDRLDDEYELILSNHTYSVSLPGDLKDAISKSFTFDEFIKIGKINNIGIPVFIMHGGNYSTTQILNKLDEIKKRMFHGINCKYIVISLPIIDKKSFATYLSNKIGERMGE